MNNYRKCDRCGTNLIARDHTIIDETKIVDGRLYYTGKKIFIIGYLQCPYCFKKFTIDDSFDRYI